MPTDNPYAFAPTQDSTTLRSSASPIPADGSTSEWLTETARLQRHVAAAGNTVSPPPRADKTSQQKSSIRLGGNSGYTPTESVQQAQFGAPPKGYRMERADGSVQKSKVPLADNSTPGTAHWATSTSQSFTPRVRAEPLKYESAHNRKSELALTNEETWAPSDTFQTANQVDFIARDLPAESFQRFNPQLQDTSNSQIYPSGTLPEGYNEFQTENNRTFGGSHDGTGLNPPRDREKAHQELRASHWKLGKDPGEWDSASKTAYGYKISREELEAARARPNPKIQESHFRLSNNKEEPAMSSNQRDFGRVASREAEEQRSGITAALQASHFQLGPPSTKEWVTHNNAAFQAVDTKKHAPQLVGLNYQKSQVMSNESDPESHKIESMAKTSFANRASEALPHIVDTGGLQRSHFSLGDTQASKPDQTFVSHAKRDFGGHTGATLANARGQKSHKDTQYSEVSFGNETTNAHMQSVTQAQFSGHDSAAMQASAPQQSTLGLMTSSINMGDNKNRMKSEASRHFVQPSPDRIPTVPS